MSRWHDRNDRSIWGESILMHPERWEELVKHHKAMSKTPTPDKIWRELQRRAPKTVARARSLKEIRALVDYVSEVHFGVERANEALASGDARFRELQTNYIDLKALVVEIARAFGNVELGELFAVPPHTEKVTRSFDPVLVKALLDAARPLLVEAGTDDLKGKDSSKSKAEDIVDSLIEDDFSKQEIMGTFQTAQNLVQKKFNEEDLEEGIIHRIKMVAPDYNVRILKVHVHRESSKVAALGIVIDCEMPRGEAVDRTGCPVDFSRIVETEMARMFGTTIVFQVIVRASPPNHQNPAEFRPAVTRKGGW